jgi:AAT family amino acid transporter
MLFSLARNGSAPRKMGELNAHGVPMPALLVSMLGIAGAIIVQYRTPNAYLYIINAALVGGMLAWLISLAAHVSFRRKVTPEQFAGLQLRAPLGAAGSVAAFVAIIAAIVCTAWVSESQVTAIAAVAYVAALSAAYWLTPKRSS